MKHNLTDIEFSKVCKVIASNLGLNFSIDRRDTVSKNLAEAAVELGFHNMKEFIHWFLSATLKKDQIEILASYLTISETYFWREQQVFDALTQKILPDLITSKKDKEKSLNIWCAGCSTGEEAYSLAIALCRIIPKIKEWKIKILATDINIKALTKASEGIYGSWSFRNSPSWLKEYYFKRLNSKEYVVIPEIKEMVTFSSFNLALGNYYTTICENNKMDIIFCRNVLMYFTGEWAARVSENLFDSISEDGWLVVSSCELSSDLFPKLSPVNFPGSVLYRKGKEELMTSDIQSYQNHNKLLFNNLQSIAQVPDVSDQLLSVNNTLNPLNPADHNILGSSTLIIPSLEENAKPLLSLEEREDNLIKSKSSILLLADEGHLDEALLICNNAIANNKLAPGLYYLRATILQEQNNIIDAINSLKQAIYIDPNYIMGHFTLGNIFKRKGIVKKAKLYFNNSLELLNILSDDDLPAESEGLSVKNIRDLILSHMLTQRSS
jgi:chemotaxis protein methyltransferase CheR